VATVPELDVKTTLAGTATTTPGTPSCGTSASPELREMRPDRLIRPPNEALEAFVAALTEPEAPDLTSRSWSGSTGCCCPGRSPPTRIHLAATSRVTDAPTIRSLGFILETRRRTGGRGRCCCRP